MSMNQHNERSLQNIPRVPLAFLPTPLKESPRLAMSIDGPRLWVKRDDATGFGFGGNKIRGLEFLLADALAQKADVIVTGAGPQSNSVRATVAAAVYAGMSAVAVYSGTAPQEVQGNYRLTRLLGAEVRFTDDADRASVDTFIEVVAAELRGKGRHPYVVPRGGANVLGTLGYVLAVHELAKQSTEQVIAPHRV